jgi:GMP synthase-like glutamine amidotransferase
MRAGNQESVWKGHAGRTVADMPFNAEVWALPPEERVAAVAASLESVWP